MALTQGQILNSRYRIVSLLGQGGFGAVYRAWDTNMERPVALKENLDTSEEAQRQFKREAQILFDLSHPNLPRVIDHFSLPGVGQYTVMEFIEGEDLDSMVRRSGPLAESDVLRWISQASEALSYLHTRTPPVIHRDIKPANIKITPGGKAVLVDFGVAKVYDPVLLTTVGARAVTPGYSPQEQYGLGKTDARTDIYALGATAYACLTGETPVESIQRNLGTRLSPVKSINPGVSATTIRAIQTAMEMLPDDRYQDMAAFRQALQPKPPEATLPAQAAKPESLPRVGTQQLSQSASQPTPPPAEQIVRQPTTPIVNRGIKQVVREYLPWLIGGILIVTCLVLYLVNPGLFGSTTSPEVIAPTAVVTHPTKDEPTPMPTIEPAATFPAGTSSQPDAESSLENILDLNPPLDPASWQTYVNPNGINDMYLDGGTIYAATNNGLVIYNTEDQSFEVLTVNQGLPANDLMAVYKDDSGSLWIGSASSGIFWGTDTSFSKVADRDELGSNFIQDITQDHQGDIWVGTRGGGAARYDGQIWERYTPDNSPVSSNVFVIYVDEDDSIWFGSAIWGCYPCGGDLVHMTSNGWEVFTSADGVTRWNDSSNTDVSSIVRVPGNALWVGGLGGISKYQDGAWELVYDGEVRTIQLSNNGSRIWSLTRWGELLSFDSISGELVYQEDKSIPSSWYSSMGVDKDEKVWFSAYGINRYIPERDLLDEFSIKTDFKGALDIKQAPDGLYWTAGGFWAEFEQVVSTFDGSIWSQSEGSNIFYPREIGISEDGMVIVATGQGLFIQDGPGWKQRYEQNFFSEVHEDPDGGLWFLTTNAQGLVVSYKDGNFREYRYESDHLPGKSFYGISFNEEGNAWISTDEGVAWIPANGDPAGIEVYDSQNGLLSDYTNDVLEDQSGRTWFATWEGISLLLPDGEWQYYQEIQAQDLAEDLDGLIWAKGVSQQEEGDFGWLSYYDGAGWNERFPRIPSDIWDDTVRMIVTSDGSLWVSFYGFGVCRLKDLQETCMAPAPYALPSANIFCLYEDRSGMVWICNQGGLTHTPVNP